MEGIAARQENEARSWWDKAGRRVTPTNRQERTALIVCTSSLVDALVTLLSAQHGITASYGAVCRDPDVAGCGEVVPLIASHDDSEVVIPVLPGEPVWRLYPQRVASGEPLGGPVTEVVVSSTGALDAPGWVPAEVIAARLAELLQMPA